MEEFIEKLIERLEDYCKPDCDGDCSKCHFSSALGIAYELEEEYEREHIIDLCNQICNKVDSIVKKDNDGWIPCNERLPEESGEYLTYVDYADETFIAIDEIDCNGLIKEWNCTPNYHVIAWQPLPKPYKKLIT